jgi:methionyl aminopeptidase
MIYYKTPEEIEFIRENCHLVCKSLALAGSMLKAGTKGSDLDKAAEEFIRSHDAKPGFKGYNGFPATLCISPNECVVHGIPTDIPFKDGDMVSIDCGVYKNGFYGDAAYTFAVGEVTDEQIRLMEVTLRSLYLGIEQAKAGNRIGDIGYAIQQYTERDNGFGVVRALVGHGLGKNLHEAPEVPNHGRRGRGIVMKKDLVIAIEPMINMGTKNVRQLDDGWTIITKDRKASAHFEHTVAITQGDADILSDHSYIEEAVKNNDNLTKISVEKPIFAVRNFDHG